MWRRIGIEPGEGRIFAWGAVTLFLVGWAEVSVKNVSETFFLKRVDVELLPAVFLASSLALVGTTYVIGRLAARRNRLHLLPLVLAVLGLTLLPLWLMVRAEVTSALALLVIAAKQIQSAALIVFLIAMGDLLHGRQAKRLFAPLLAGMTLGAILGSFASYPLSRVIGIGGLLPFSAGVLLVSALTTLPLRNLVPLRLERRFGQRNLIGPDDSEDAKPTLRGMWAESGLFRLMLLSTLFAGLLGPMLYFQFQYVADLSTREGGEDQLLALYSQFRGWLSIAILLTQLDTASRLYRRIGIPLSAALSPLVYLLGFFGLSVRLSLGAGVGAMTATKVQDNAVYDPAQRILFNLFPERIRSWATALLEGPLKRGGGALGNVVIIAALAVGTAPLVGYIALPISLAWFGVGLMLWRSYPALLLQASAVRGEFGRDLDLGELLDRGTVRGLATHLLEDDPRACSAAIDLVGEARVELAAEALAAAACNAPVANRALLVTALDRRVQRDGGCPDRAIVSGRTRRELEAFLADPVGLDDGDRAALVRAYAWLCGEDDEARNILEPGLRDESPGVRLATVAALHGNAANEELDGALAAAVQGDDAVARRIARDELRCLLLATEPEDDGWKPRFDLLVSLLANASERDAAAACLADVAEQHGDAAAGALTAMLALKDGEADARIALLRYLGAIGAADEAPWMVEQLGADSEDAETEEDGVQQAAVDALRALGAEATEAMLVELTFGRRSRRDAILNVVRDLEVDGDTLQGLYERELAQVQRTLVHLHGLRAQGDARIVAQRLDERVAEGLHTCLLLLAAIHREDQIAELGERLKRGTRSGRQRAILLEALESLLDPREQAEMMPLLDDRELAARARSAARGLGSVLPSSDDIRAALLEDPDSLTRLLAGATLGSADGLAGEALVADPAGVLSAIDVALLLRTLPLFEGLTTRQLVDLAKVVHEEHHPAGTRVVREGDFDECMYLIVEGEVRIAKGETTLAELGPRSFFGEMAVFEGTTRSADAIATTPVQLLRLERNDLMRLMEELPAIAISVCQTLSRRVRDVSDRVRS